MSKEREVIYEMIEEREKTARAKHRHIDELYDWYDTKAPSYGAFALHEEISKLYAETLLLKMVLYKADTPDLD